MEVAVGGSTSVKVTVSSGRVGEGVGVKSPVFLRLECGEGEKKVLMELWMEGIDTPRCFFEGDCGGEMSGGGWDFFGGPGERRVTKN